MAKSTALTSANLESLIKSGASDREIKVAFKRFIEENVYAKLQKIDEKLEEIHDMSHRAKNTGGFGAKLWNKVTLGFGDDGSRERDDILAEMNELNAEATADLATVVQGCIELTCGSIKYTEYMIDTMGGMMTDGFKDSDGRVLELSENSKESMRRVIDASKKHVARLMATESKIDAIENKININVENIAANASRLDKKDELDEAQSKMIEGNAANIATNAENINKNAQGIADNASRLEEKDELDNEQSAQIAALQSKVADLEKEIEDLKNAKNGGALGIVALVIALAALGAAVFALLGGKI